MIGEWNVRELRTVPRACYAADAQDACERAEACSGIHDLACRGFSFYLCDRAHNFSTPRVSQGSGWNQQQKYLCGPGGPKGLHIWTAARDAPTRLEILTLSPCV